MAQTEEFMFQNVAFRPSVYKIGNKTRMDIFLDCRFIRVLDPLCSNEAVERNAPIYEWFEDNLNRN